MKSIKMLILPRANKLGGIAEIFLFLNDNEMFVVPVKLKTPGAMVVTKFLSKRISNIFALLKLKTREGTVVI